MVHRHIGKHYKNLFSVKRLLIIYLSMSSGRGSYIHSSASPPPYLSSHSPTPMGPGLSYSSYPDNIVYTSIGKKYLNSLTLMCLTFIHWLC